MCRYQQKMTLYRAYMVLLYTRFCFVGKVVWYHESWIHKAMPSFGFCFGTGTNVANKGKAWAMGKVAGRIRSHSCTSRVQGFLWWDSGRLSFTKKNMLRPFLVHFAARLPKTTELANLALENGSQQPSDLVRVACRVPWAHRCSVSDAMGPVIGTCHWNRIFTCGIFAISPLRGRCDIGSLNKWRYLLNMDLKKTNLS